MYGLTRNPETNNVEPYGIIKSFNFEGEYKLVKASEAGLSVSTQYNLFSKTRLKSLSASKMTRKLTHTLLFLKIPDNP